MLKANSKTFIKNNFPELGSYKVRTSRMYENKEKPGYLDDWWFNFSYSEIENLDYIIFAGALDYSNKDFKIFKVPTKFLKDNLDSIDMNNKGWINLYIHLTDLTDIRHKSRLSFKEFVVTK